MRILKPSIIPIVLSCAVTAQAQEPPASPAPSAALERAFTYSFPLHEMGNLRLQQLGDGRTPGRQRLGEWFHMRQLAGAADRLVTAPNNDTLYSLAWLDLSQGPVKLSVPDTEGRYDSIAILDAYTNNVAILGQRVTGTRAAEFVLVGPQWISRSMRTGETWPVTLSAEGAAHGGEGGCTSCGTIPAISGDGKWVTFADGSTNLVSGVSDGLMHYWLVEADACKPAPGTCHIVGTYQQRNIFLFDRDGTARAARVKALTMITETALAPRSTSLSLATAGTQRSWPVHTWIRRSLRAAPSRPSPGSSMRSSGIAVRRSEPAQGAGHSA